MNDQDTKRLTRIVAILTQLQSKRLLTAPELATKFGITVRTIYRDIRLLQRAGVPVITEEGRGYSIMEGYRLPPVMFTEAEANALVTAEKIVGSNSDVSFIKQYAGAVSKIKAVLRPETKDKAALLWKRTKVYHRNGFVGQTVWLPLLQNAVTAYHPVRMEYRSPISGHASARTVEPFALLLGTNGAWLMVALCRLRKAYRIFRLDGIQKADMLPETFPPHRLTLEQYFSLSEKDSATPDTGLS